jgi:hypothetical protein
VLGRRDGTLALDAIDRRRTARGGKERIFGFSF